MSTNTFFNPAYQINLEINLAEKSFRELTRMETAMQNGRRHRA
jgi:hypothetical protein